jgi:serine/threonine protein kinase
MRRGRRGRTTPKEEPIPVIEEKSSSEEEVWKSDNSDGYDSGTEDEADYSTGAYGSGFDRFRSDGYVSDSEKYRHNVNVEGLTSEGSESNPTDEEMDSEYENFLFSEMKFNYDFNEPLVSWRGGSYSQVFKAIKRPENRWVAIKVLIAGFKFADKRSIMRECEIIRALMQSRHRNIAEFYETMVFPDRSRGYFVSELSEIGDLFDATQRITETGERIWVPLEEFEAKHLIRGVAEGLRHMHSLGIAHGDLKPENILLFFDETQEHKIDGFDRFLPKITDFSNSRMRRPHDPPNQIIKNYRLCSYSYAAPESHVRKNFWGEFDRESISYDMLKADVYSLGVCLLALLLGARPFDLGWDHPKPEPLSPRCRADAMYPDWKKGRYWRLVTNYDFMVGLRKRGPGFLRCNVSVFEKPLRQLLLSILEPEPADRITLEQFLSDQWFSLGPEQRLQSIRAHWDE